ncbi:serine/threonine-protein kinase, partial [Streptomyces sp. HSW2009]|uniref:serine/threonine-protein kinase n=1 Tax=Streptomyces sp. HSW2009 TaxID=3142890 RepID=UPI0032ED4E19
MVGNGGNARLIAGRYRLVGQLGRGGMGTVWRAQDELLGRQVAVKELHLVEGLSALDAQVQRERTLREARTVAQLKHPHVIVLHDVVEQDERPWIVMELVDGRSLADQLAERGPVDRREAARIALALLDALATAHGRGVLHRDIKPANVLIEAPTGRVVLTDFGIAQVTGATTITETGTFVGSPEYTAPERMSGHRTGPESDLWSLGVLLCTLVSGESPFRRDSLGGVLHAVVFDEIRAPAEAGPLAPVILGLLTRDPARRLTTAGARTLLGAYAANPPSGDGFSLRGGAFAPPAGSPAGSPSGGPSSAGPAPGGPPYGDSSYGNSAYGNSSYGGSAYGGSAYGDPPYGTPHPRPPRPGPPGHAGPGPASAAQPPGPGHTAPAGHLPTDPAAPPAAAAYPAPGRSAER